MLTFNFMTLLSYIGYFSMDLALFLAGGFIFVKFTPINELAEMAHGNVAAGVALSGAMIGFALVIFSTTTHSYGIVDTMVWTVIALLAQILAVEVMRLILRLVHDDWKAQIQDRCMAHGTFSGAFSLAVGIINAACVT